ncbi:MAG: N-acetylmuramoyl-L-alanine amidase [Armatimonadetes bacterium]|nr:N-acetylmuramoyl-L-alanine amidase [Armatimonadota bacterium]
MTPLICIDPGHPSEVGPGTRGKVVTEIHAAWREAVLLRKILRHDGYRVVFTKGSEHQFVANKRRSEVANRRHAALMIRLHCDCSTSTGFTIYYPDRQGQDGARLGPTLAVLQSSEVAARAFYPAFKARLNGALADNGLLPDAKTMVGSQHGALVGSIYAKEPVLLVEMATLTNPFDEKFMRSRAGERLMARALAAGTEAALKALRGSQ